MDSKNASLKAKEILNIFMEEMNEILIDGNYNVIRNKSLRDEKEGLFALDKFREAFLNNASKRSNDAILTRKGDWV
ncbi:MAG: hypothetical protein ACMXYB_01095 [Candidatus Woesearchaeota archaeon]